jgi:hypothetical protein
LGLQTDQSGWQTETPIYTELPFTPRPPPCATSQILDGLLDYQYGVLAPDTDAGALAGIPPDSAQRPPPPETPSVIRQVLQGAWQPGMPPSWAQRPLSFATREVASNSAAEKRSAPRDASHGRDTVFMPPPAKIPRQKTGASGRKVMITDAMLREWATLGPAGIKAAGGLGGLAERDNVLIATMATYLRADGSLTQHGRDRLDPGGKAEITCDMLQRWAALGKAEIKAAGGLGGLPGGTTSRLRR